MKANVAVLAGGYSGEYSVSIRSAASILGWLGQDPYNCYLLTIDREQWTVHCPDESKQPLNKNDFSFEYQGQRIAFDYALITIHGTPGEDGLIQGYLDMLQIPYNTGGVLVEALTFNKYMCNQYLRSFGIRSAKSMLLRRDDKLDEEAVQKQLGLPVFVKPNLGGSSLATRKISAREDLAKAVEEAFGVSDEVIIESLLQGAEFTCGCYPDAMGQVKALPITEVLPKNEFFDFDAKYHGAVEEITPARISDEESNRMQQLSLEIYRLLGAQGIIRVDYIVEADGLPTLLEVNTTPGMTATSFIPQQVAAAGLEMKQVLCDIIGLGLKDK